MGDHNKIFGAELRARREEKGWSQEELGWRANLSRQYVSRLELGDCSPTLDTVAALSIALSISLDVIVTATARRLNTKGSGDDDRPEDRNAR